MIITTTINDKPIMVETYLEDDGDGFPKLGDVKDLWGKDLDLNDEDEERVLADAVEYIQDVAFAPSWSDLDHYTGS